jgi:hypothetical protein
MAAGVTHVFDDLPGWAFYIEERSPGLYVVQGSDFTGVRVSEEAVVDADAALDRCKAWVARVLEANS